MGTDRPTEKDVWKYIPQQVAGARATVYMNRIKSVLLEPVERLLDWLTRKVTR